MIMLATAGTASAAPGAEALYAPLVDCDGVASIFGASVAVPNPN